MDVFLGEWGNLLLRWAHMIVGIGWIGTSFYFMALEYSLNQQERKSPGVFGTAWQVHGGGFYHVEKFTVAPRHLPPHLHWFKWEAYLTWVTGFGLLIVQYYFHASAYLIDPAVMPLQPWQAIAISIARTLTDSDDEARSSSNPASAWSSTLRTSRPVDWSAVSSSRSNMPRYRA